MKLTIAVRTYNSERIIPRLIERLQALEVPTENYVELLFVDNNSQDATVSSIQSSLTDLPIEGRVVVELQPGAASARVRALCEAQGDYVAFLDDDNLPRANWLLEICRALSNHPQAAALSGRIRLLSESSIPSYVKPYLNFYAIVDRGNRAFRYDETPKKVMPPGAGLILRRSDAISLLKNGTLRLAGPVGQGFHFKGEDIELLIRLQSSGGQIWYCPDIVIDHALSPHRFTPEYLSSFLKAAARPRHYHRLLRYRRRWWLLITLVFGANDFRHWLIHLLRYNDSLDWRLRYEFYRYLLISPLYTWHILTTSPPSLQMSSAVSLPRDRV